LILPIDFKSILAPLHQHLIFKRLHVLDGRNERNDVMYQDTELKEDQENDGYTALLKSAKITK
jgi:hypothetical protein